MTALDRLSGLLVRVRGLGGFGILVVAYTVLAGSLVQFLLANNARRRMDFALSGGGAALCLVLLAATVMMVERLQLAGDRESVASRALAAELRAAAGEQALVTVRPLEVADFVLASHASYHRPGCMVAAGRPDLREIELKAARKEGLTPCRLCQADA